MSKKTLRMQNECEDCRYTWYPRGKSLSTACPKCGGKNVTYPETVSGSTSRYGSGAGTLIAIVIAVAAIYFFSHRNPEVPGADTATSSPINTPPVVNRPVVVEQPTPTAKQLESTTVVPSLSQTHTSGVESPIAAAVVEDTQHKLFTDDEIDRLEEEKQYHGDDPIVRARLGLPSRTTKKLEP